MIPNHRGQQASRVACQINSSALSSSSQLFHQGIGLSSDEQSVKFQMG